MEHIVNQILLRGTLSQLPQFSHENHGKRFYSFPLEVERLSGTVDILPILMPEQVLWEMDLSGGDMLEITGQIRTFNNHGSDGRKLIISVYAQTLAACEGVCINEAELTGTICKPPICRMTPLGRQICDVMLAVNRPYHRADYIPCILWGQTARLAADCEVGTQLHLTGRFQSRQYIKVIDGTNVTRTAYELSAMTAEIL